MGTGGNEPGLSAVATSGAAQPEDDDDLDFDFDEPVPGDEDSRRLLLYRYLNLRYRRTYLAIMRLFTSTLLADLSTGDVAAALAKAEQDGLVDAGESDIDRVAQRLKKLVELGNLHLGRRENTARSIAEHRLGGWRYQVDKLALRVQRDAEEVLRVAEGAREVTRELLPAIEQGLAQIAKNLSDTLVAERTDGPDSAKVRRGREQLATRVTTVFLQQGELAETVRDFYAHVGQIVARYDLNPEEIAGFRALLVDYIQIVVEDVLRYTPAIAEMLTKLSAARPELLRLLDSGHGLGEDTERAGGRSARDWQGFNDWFLDAPGRPVSQVRQLREATARAVGALLSNVRRTTSGNVIAPGRRQDLLRLAAIADTSTQDQADALYAAVFGLSPARHLLEEGEPDAAVSAQPWSQAPAIPVLVSVAERPDRATRGRAARVKHDPLGEQASLAEQEERKRHRRAALAELAAAAANLAEVELSTGAQTLLYDLVREAMTQRTALDETGQITVAEQDTHVRVTVRHDPDKRASIRSRAGTLTVLATALDVERLEPVVSRGR